MIALLISAALAGTFDAYDTAMASGDKRAAANALIAVTEDAEALDAHAEAWVKLGDLFVSFTMPYAGLIAYSEGISRDPSAAAGALPSVFESLTEVGDEMLLGDAIARSLQGEDAATGTLPGDAEHLGRMGLVAGRFLFRRGELGPAMAAIALVQPEAESYPDAMALKGVILSQQGRPEAALAPFVTAQTVGTQNGRGARFDDLMDLNIARSYYAAENYGQSIAWYAKIDRGSDFWPEAQFERAWAHFRADDMAGALSLLHTHQSPFFDEWNFAEADLLRAYAFFLLCKFSETTKRIDRFSETYTPIRDSLQTTLGTMGPSEAFASVRAARSGQPSQLPRAILRPFLWEDRFTDAIDATGHVDDEVGRLASQAGQPFAEAGTRWLTARRDQLVEEEGARVLARAREDAAELDDMLKGLEITRLDILDFETRLYEKAANTGTVDFGDRIGKLRKLRKTRGVMVWPFQGEYWEDELGHYRFDAPADCPAEMAVTPG